MGPSEGSRRPAERVAWLVSLGASVPVLTVATADRKRFIAELRTWQRHANAPPDPQVRGFAMDLERRAPGIGLIPGAGKKIRRHLLSHLQYYHRP